jgi:type IV secretion system protein VirD4
LVGHDRANGGIRLDPAVQSHEAVVPQEPKRDSEIGGFADDPDDGTIVAKEMDQKLHRVARQAALDRGDGLGM